jgi:thiamine-phosphate pyrophosphorylase
VLHQHHELVDALGLGGRHFKDEEGGLRRQTEIPRLSPAGSVRVRRPADAHGLTSRSSHDLAPLKASLGRFDRVLFGPVFPSISKKGYGPGPDFPSGELKKLLAGRGKRRKATSVFAIGGVSSENLALCKEMGFDGVAVHGAVWGVPNSAGAYSRLRDTAASLQRRSRAA